MRLRRPGAGGLRARSGADREAPGARGRASSGWTPPRGLSHLLVAHQGPLLPDVLLRQVDGWKDRGGRAAEEKSRPLPLAASRRRAAVPGSPPRLTHHSPAQQPATACSSRNRASGTVQGQGGWDLPGLPHPRSGPPSQIPWEEPGLPENLPVCPEPGDAQPTGHFPLSLLGAPCKHCLLDWAP